MSMVAFQQPEDKREQNLTITQVVLFYWFLIFVKTLACKYSV